VGRTPYAALVLLPIIGLAITPLVARSAGDDELVAVEQILQTERAQEQALEQAAADLERDVGKLRLALVEAARRSHDHEERISALEIRLTELTKLEAEKREALARRKDDLAATLGALQRLSRQPPEALAATPTAIDDSIRASLLLSTVVPLIDSAAKALGSDLEILAALHREIATERLELGETRDSLAAERQRIDGLHQQKVALYQDTETQRDDARDQVVRLAAEAKSLRDLLARLTPAPDDTPAPAAILLPADEKPEAPAPVAVLEAPEIVVTPPVPSRSISEARGDLPMPARGRLVALFGDPSNGVRNKGISIETRDGAQVVTPYDGEGYHTLLAGFSRIDSILGQWLLAGEPVGIMGWGSNGGPVLYVELRRNGVAINPLPWLAVSENKVSG
jgi:septal ring factor EnvC (AmiA/AmiB activator)